MSAIVFDCDGVLADTERFGHLPAFNRMFQELGLPVRWSEVEYGRRLRIGGGKERLASLLTTEFVERAGLPRDRDAQLAEVARWHARKTQIYLDIVAAGSIPPRPGIRRLASNALERGWRLAVASTSAEASVRAILQVAVGDLAPAFILLAGDVVPHKKPAPDIYLLALERLGAEVGETVVIEDSQNGLNAATGASLPCVVTVNDYTADEDFTGAALVVSSLGDPDGESSAVIANRLPVTIGAYVVLEHLDAAMAWRPATGWPAAPTVLGVDR